MAPFESVLFSAVTIVPLVLSIDIDYSEIIAISIVFDSIKQNIFEKKNFVLIFGGKKTKIFFVC